jgi:type I restriction enzyme M protein
LIVAILEPFHGRILDPACGSGGMFVQSARFVQNHRHDPNADATHHIYAA